MGLYLWTLLFTIIHVILLGNFTFCIPEAEHMWGKCITSRKDKIHVTCPLGYVIYRPVFYVAAHTRHDKESCGFSATDCHGQARDTSVQINKCLWENTCTLRWHEHMPIVKSSNSSCVGVTPNYVAFNNPLCLPSDKLYDICDYNASVIDADSGVLSNRQSSLHSYNDRGLWRSFCGQTETQTQSDTSVTVDAATHCNEGSFRLSYVPSSGHEQPLACGTRLHSIFAVTSGEIVVDFFSHLGHGGSDETFVILFEQKPFQHQTQEILLGDDARVISTFGETSFNVRAFHQQLPAPDGGVGDPELPLGWCDL
ncbi:uncharacterized protein LOC112576186 [Pomacea canaliculata]|uniref:uncharacterized protein LOC112576186 n=1 Tax=Pomacea canaliculata TaxID=400727 RepID=UPI000D72BAA6|nr:uncharacterized protein LOC112576186 [Pomacea canaliculata]